MRLQKTKNPGHEPGLHMKNLNRLHQILCLASSVAALLAYGIVAELSVFENTLHLDNTTPSAH